MPQKLLVKANPGEKCPREENPRTYITDDPKGTPVDGTTFYRRLLNDGSLVIVDGTKKKTGGDA
jgi:hypothetical protein